MKRLTHMGELGMGGMIILEWIWGVGCKDAGWIQLGQVSRVQ
jgi:hypothetical protein